MVALWDHAVLEPLKLVNTDIKDAEGKVKTSKYFTLIISMMNIIVPIFKNKLEKHDIHILEMVLNPIMKTSCRGLESRTPRL